MIRVSSVVDKIAEKCFTQEEKAILEFTIGERNITVASQLKHYYSLACWHGDEESLFDAICIRKEERKDLLRKIQSFNEKLHLAIDPGSFDEVYVRMEGSRSSSAAVNTMAEGSSSTSRNNTTTTADDKSDTWSISGTKDAIGEMDEVNKIQDVWQSESLNHGSVTPQESGQHPPAITQPSIALGDNPSQDIKYRQFTTSKAINEDATTVFSSEKVAADATSSSNSSSAGVNVNRRLGDKSVGGRRFKTGEQLVDIWKDEIQSLRVKFWLIFHGLFMYERNY